MRDRKINNLDELTDNGKLEYEPGISENKNLLYSNEAILWHVILGHASLKYLMEFHRRYPHIKSLKDVNFDNTVIDCEVCIVAKFNRLPFSSTRQRDNEPLQVVHADTMGPISPASHPRGYIFISVFINDHTRLTMAYPMKNKNETGYCLQSFIKSSRNLLEYDAKSVTCSVIKVQDSQEDIRLKFLKVLELN